MTENLLDVTIDFVIETTGYVLAGVGAGPNDQDS